MLESGVTGDRNNLIDLQKMFWEIKCKIVQSSGVDLKHDGAAAFDTARTDAPFAIMCCIHFSLTAQCQPTD